MKTLIGMLVALLGVYASGVHAANTAAGTVVKNTAAVQYTVLGDTLTQTTSANFTVQQIVNVTVTWQNTSDVIVSNGTTDATLLFKVTNTGNGLDSFKLSDALVTPAGTSFNPAGCLVYFDTAKTGVYAASDVLYNTGSNDPSLAVGASVDMLIVCNVPNSVADLSLGEMQLTATSKTATGSFGTVSTGGGVGGVDAIVGATGGTGNSTGIYQAHVVLLAYAKSATVLSPSGGNQATSGSTITYTLTVTPSGSATAGNVVVTDPLPANTTFVNGSLLLNGAAVGAAGDYNLTTPGAVTVKLGNVAGSAAAQVIAFQVTIN